MRSSTTTTPRVAVVLIDSLTVVRAGLKLLLGADQDIEVIAEAGSAEGGLEAIRRLKRRSRVVVAMGLDLQGARDGFWLIRQIREAFPSMPILITGAESDGMLISQALFVGVDSFVNKNAEPSKFIEAIRRTADGEVVLEGLPRGTFEEMAEDRDRQKASATILTERELEVLTVAAEGLTARQMARRLGVQERTITTHLGRIYRKLGATGRVSAIAVGTRSGILRMPAGTGAPGGGRNEGYTLAFS